MELWVAIIGMLATGLGTGGITKVLLELSKQRQDAYAKRYIRRLEARLDDLEEKLDGAQQHVFDLTVQCIKLEGEADCCPLRNLECPRQQDHESSFTEM